MPLQMQLSPLWAGLAVYSSKIINDKKEIPEYTSGISFFAVICCKKTFSLNRSYYGLYIPKGKWREMNNFSTNSLALVLSSTEFDKDDYIFDYEQFINLVK